MPINITEEFVRNLMEQNTALIAQVANLSATVESLNQTIKELQEQLNKNSRNSSKPPSSDGLKKLPVNKDRSLRGKSEKKQGAQDGHSGVYLSVLADPNEVKHHMHPDCTRCPYHDSCLERACVKETRHDTSPLPTPPLSFFSLPPSSFSSGTSCCVCGVCCICGNC